MNPNHKKKQVLKRFAQSTSMLVVSAAFMLSAGDAEAVKAIVAQPEQTVQSRIATLRDKLNQQNDKMHRAEPQGQSDFKLIFSQWNNWKNH